MFIKKQKIKLSLVTFIALASIFVYLAPALAQSGENCCVCTDFGGKDVKYAPGVPDANGKCDQHITYSTECYGEGCATTPDKVCSVKGGSCKSWQAAIDKVSGEEAAKKELLPATPPVLQVNIPGLTFTGEIKATMEEMGRRYYNIPWLAEYIGAVYRFGVSVASVLAIVMIIIGGFIWMTSAGNQARITQAKGYISGALIGLCIALGSYGVLKVVNPALVNLRPLKILMIEFEDLTGVSTNDDTAAANLSFSPSTPTGDTQLLKLNNYKGRPIILDKSIANTVQQILQQLIDGGFQVKDASSHRPNQAGFSWHKSGLAIDINPAENPCPCCYTGTDYKQCSSDKWKPGVGGAVTKEVVDAFKAQGFCWGGDWCHFKDYMHFSKPSNSASKECGNGGNGCPYQW
ncbi:MAG: M15 family metallopeptidase [Patescibacteria group bacterium]